jgi:hypothetical protein
MQQLHTIETTARIENGSCLFLDETLPNIEASRVRVMIFLPEDVSPAATPPDTLSLRERLRRIADHCAALPVLDARSPDEILGYDEHGVPR